MSCGVLGERALDGAAGAGKTKYAASSTATATTQRSMTSSDRNDDLVTAQEKLEWVTPKISLMETDDTCGKSSFLNEINNDPFFKYPVGPS